MVAGSRCFVSRAASDVSCIRVVGGVEDSGTVSARMAIRREYGRYSVGGAMGE